MSHAPAALAIYLLGPPRIERHGQPVEVDTRKAIALLAYLALHPARRSRDQLAALFWPEYDQERAYANLRRTLWALNKAIGADWLAADNLTLALRQQPGLWVDVTEFQRLLATCHTHPHGRDAVCPACLEPLAQAVPLARGEFLEGFTLRDSAPFDDWLNLEAETLRKSVMTALAKLVQGYSTQADYATALTYARQWLALDPLDETIHRWLMQLYAWRGQPAAALRQYQACVRLLKAELDAPPDAATTALYQQINRGAIAAPAPAAPTPPPTPPHNLPGHLTSFVGREQEIAEISALLVAAPGTPGQGVRLLTLTGAGGSGKTRLALQVAGAVLARYPDGVWFVDLAALTDPTLVAQAVATVLNLREQAGHSLTAILVEALKTRRLLLILDNCEHLAAACAQLSEALLRAGPALQILATSRATLAISGEIAWRVPGLARPPLHPLPPLAELAHVAAVQLFVARAATAAPKFSLTAQNAPAVVQICRRLDGLPLALELAAARVKLLTVEQIAARLDDRFRLLTNNNRNVPARQQTLRTTLDWSYNLLTAAERLLLRRLAIFAGGFTWEAYVEVAAGADPDPAGGLMPPGNDLLDRLGHLVDKSLVVVDRQPNGEVRYRLLETIRQYAWERLAESGEAALLHAHHAAFYTVLAEAAQPALFGDQQMIWFQRLETELDNLRAALTWSLSASGVAEWGVRLAAALGRFWTRHISEGYNWLELALTRTATLPPTAARANAFCYAGDMANNLGDLMTAKMRLEEGIALWRTLGDQAGLARALTLLPEILRDSGDYEKIPPLMEECFALWEQLGDQWGMAWALNELAVIAIAQQAFPRAHAYGQRAYALYHAIGDKQRCGLAQHTLGMAAEAQGDYATARHYFEAALALFRTLDDQILIAMELNSLGITLRYQGDLPGALACFCESLTLVTTIGFTLLLPYCLASLAGIAASQGQWAAAVQLCSVVEQRCGRHGMRLQPRYHTIYARDVAALRAQLAEEAFAAAWAEGQSMTDTTAIALAKVVKLA